MLGSTLLLRPALSRLQVNAPRVWSVGGGITIVALLVFVCALGGVDARGQGRPPEPVPALTQAALGQAPVAAPSEVEELDNSRPLWVNDPPAVQLTGTRTTATVGETVTFTPVVTDSDPLVRYAYYLSRAGQPDTLLSQGLLSAGAQPPAQQHTFNSEGTYAVTLYVQDRWGAWGDGAASVTVTAPPGGPLVADFVVEKLTAVDPDGTKHWQVLDLSQPIEFGLRVRFRSTSTGPAAYLYWDFGDGVYGDGASVLHQYTAAGPRVVTLAVYSADWSQWSEKRRTVTVGGPMQRVSQMPLPPSTFFAQRVDQVGDELWAVSQMGDIGAAQIGQPAPLPALAIMPVPPLGYGVVTDIDVSEEPLAQRKLYVACGNSGVKVYQANRGAFTWLRDLPVSYFGGKGVVRVESIGSVLYALTFSPCTLYAFDMTNPQSPQLLDSLAMPSGGLGLGAVDGVALIVLNTTTRFTLVDARLATDLRSSAVVDLPQYALGDVVQSVGRRYAIAACNATLLYDLEVPLTGGVPLTTTWRGTAPAGSIHFALDECRLYVYGSSTCYKFDVTDPSAPYLLQEFTPTQNTVHSIVRFRTAAGVPFVLTSAGYPVFESWASP